MTMIKMVNLKRAIKSVEVRYIKKYDGYCEVVREGNQVTTTRLDEEGQKYHQKIERMRGLQSSKKGCIVCGCDFKISNHSTCNNPNNETK